MLFGQLEHRDRGIRGGIMRKNYASTSMAIVALAVSLSIACAQPESAEAPAESATTQNDGSQLIKITNDDYVEILQLYARYSQAVDLIRDDGSAYSSNFTEDGVLKFGTTEIKGRAAIKEWANSKNKSSSDNGQTFGLVWSLGRHVITNVRVIPIGPTTAQVIAYFTRRVADDVVEKTPEGWLLKKRGPRCGTEADHAADPNIPVC